MATNWANKFHNRWFVRVDGKGIPVYGSLISRSYNPSKGSNRFIEVIIPNQICCVTPPVETLVTGTFEVGGSILVSISNAIGQISTFTSANGGDAPTSITALASLLNADLPGYGTWTANDSQTGIILSNPTYSDLVITAEFQPAA